MEFKLVVLGEHAALTDEPVDELCRLLAVVRDRLRDGQLEGMLFDSNGNQSGTWSLRPEPRR